MEASRRGVKCLLAAWALAAGVLAAVVGVVASLEPPPVSRAREPAASLAVTLSLSAPEPVAEGSPDMAPEPAPPVSPPMPKTAAPSSAPTAPAVEGAPKPSPKTPSPASPRTSSAASEEKGKAEKAEQGGKRDVVPPSETAAASASPLPSRPEVEVEEAALPPPVQDPALIERRLGLGPLPRIAPDGRKPWQVYARPFDPADTRPRVAVVVSDLGLSGAATEAAIQTLPGGVTLAFSPYAPRLQEWIEMARAAGHEVLIAVPMEPADFPSNDPGPKTLLTTLTPESNIERLEWVLSRATGYVGITNHMGSRFTIAPKSLRPVLIALRDRGLLFLDSRSSARSVAARLASEVGLPRALNDRFIDEQASRAAIDEHLKEIERIARESGVAVAMGFPYPVTLERLKDWLPTLEQKGFALAPVSAVADRQPTR